MNLDRKNIFPASAVTRVAGFIAAAGSTLSSLAEQVQAAASPAPLTVQTPSAIYSMFRMLGALAIVVALFFCGLWLFRNWQKLTARNGKTPQLKVLEVKSLGPRHSLYVVGYQEQRFLLSSAPAGINLLSTLPCAPLEEVTAPVKEALARPANFAQVLASLLAPGARRGGPA